MSARVAHLFRPEVRRGAVLPVLLVLTWWFVTRQRLVNEHLLVAPGAVLRTGAHYLAGGEIWIGLKASLLRDAAGFSLGTLAGLTLGAAMGASRLVDRLVGPSFHAMKNIALFAWIPLLSVWFGFGEPAKIAFISMCAFYPVVVNTYEGVRSVSREHVEVARVLQCERWRFLREVVLPSASPSIFAGVHLALIYSWLGTMGAEYLLAAGPGIGNLMVDGREQFKMDQVILGVVITGVVGYALNLLASAVEAHALRWRPRAAR